MGNRAGYLLSSTGLTAVMLCATSVAYANPVDGVVVAGQASILQAAKKLDIHQQSDKAVIDWRGFDIDVDEHTEFQQPAATSIALNRVNSNSASTINGKLSANGNVIIINQNGVMFGVGAKVDVNGLVVTTADTDTNHFMNGNGKVTFDKKGKSDAAIINHGQITVKEAGLAGFVAPNVVNNGVITAKLGKVQLASGSTATVDMYGDGLVQVAVSDDVTSQLVANNGLIQADGGSVQLTAAAGKDIVNSLITNSGQLHAQTVGMKNGKITISALGTNAVAGNIATHKGKESGESKIIIAGSIDASGNTPGSKGGEVTVTGDYIELKPTTYVSTTGDAGGGTIKIGGDYHGEGNTPSAKNLVVMQGAKIENSAITTGNGGSTVLWSDGNTFFEGFIEGRGGLLSGNGSFVEVSGREWLHYDGLAHLIAEHGAFGTLLLDPTDITISSAANSNSNNASGTFTGTAGTSNINVTTLVTQLGSSNVIVNSSSGTGGNGDITVADAISWSSTRTLTLTAGRDIFINAAISSSGNGSTFTATGRDIFFNANVTNTSTTSGGTISATASRDLTVANGVTLTSGAVGGLFLAAANNGIYNTGTLNLTGAILSTGTGSLTLNSGVNGTRPSWTVNGSNLIRQGATFGSVNIQGFTDLTIDRDLNSTSGVSIQSIRDLTLAVNRTITTGSTSGLSLMAAGNTPANTGNLTINGNLAVGNGNLNLTSGVNGTRPSWTMDSSNMTRLNTTFGATTIVGFNDFTIDRDFNSNGNITMTAVRDLTVNSSRTITSGSASSLTLNAANGSTAGTGIFTNNGVIQQGTGALTIVSGLDGSGNKADLLLNSSTFGMTGASIGTPTITGFRDVTLGTGITLSANTSMTLTTSRDIFFNAALTTSGSGGYTITAGRDLVVGASGSLTTGTTGLLSLRAAGGNTASAGTFTLSGSLSIGNGAFTLLSGLDGSGNRNNLTLSGTNYAQSAANIAAISFTGFNDVNINTNITSFAASVVTANRNLTIGSGATFSATGHTLNAANANAANTGIFTNNGKIRNGTGSITIVSGLDGSGNKTDLNLNSSSFAMSGANIGVPTFTGFRDVTFATDIITGNTLTLTTTRDVFFNALYAATTSAGINVTAGRNLTVGSSAILTPGPTGLISLRAAGGSTSGTGQLTISGALAAGTGTFTLLSGLDVSGNLTNLTLSSSNFTPTGATVGVSSITGFQDIAINTNFNSSGANTITAGRHLTIGTGATLTGSSNVLNAANSSASNTGIFTNNGILRNGVGALTILSGVDGSGNKTDLVLNNSNFAMTGANIGAPTFTGFRDVTFDTNLTLGNNTSMTLTTSRDIFFNALFNTTGNGGYTITAGRDLTVAAGQIITTGATGAISLRAANGSTGGSGNLNINGQISAGSSAFTLLSGANGTRPSLTLNSSNLNIQSTLGAVTISGYDDITIDRDISSNNAISITAMRDLTLNASRTISPGSSSSISLSSANANTSGVGNLNLNGLISAGTNGLTLITGANGTRPSWTVTSANLQRQGATFGAINIQGFQDFIIDRDINSSSTISVIARKDLTVNATRNVSGTGVSLQAANASINNTGIVTINGSITHGTGALTLLSGLDGSGNRADLTINNSIFGLSGATIGAVTISGYRDINSDYSWVSNGAFNLTAQRNLTINNTISNSGGLTLQSAGGNIANEGIITLNAQITCTNTPLTMKSGVDGSGNRVDLNFNTANFNSASLNALGSTTIDGFRDININTAVNNVGTTSGINFTAHRDINFNQDFSAAGNAIFLAKRDINLVTGKTISSGTSVNTGVLNLKAANGDTTGATVGQLNLNGTLSVMSGALTLYNGVDGAGNRTDFALNTSNTVARSGTFGSIDIQGYRDIGINRDITSNNNIIIKSMRDLTLAATKTLTSGSAYGIVLSAAGGDINAEGVLTLTDTRVVTGSGVLQYFTGSHSGVRPSLTLNSTNFQQLGVGHSQIDLQGFQDITLDYGINATGVTILNATRDVTIGSYGGITSTSTGNAITIKAGRNFINQSGSDALAASNGRWLIYSTNPTANNVDGLAHDFRRFSCTYGGTCPTIPTSGNGMLYSYTPYLTVTPSSINVTYGAAANISNYGYALAGYLDNDASRDSVMGVLYGTSNYSSRSPVGRYGIYYSYGSLVSALGYDFYYANNPLAIAVTAGSASATTIPDTVMRISQNPFIDKIGNAIANYTNLPNVGTGFNLFQNGFIFPEIKPLIVPVMSAPINKLDNSNSENFI